MRKLSPVRVEDAGVVQEAVEDRRGDVGVGEGRAQVGDAAVGGKDVEPCWSRQLMIWHSGWRLRRGAVGSRARDGQPCPAVPEAHRRGPAVVERGLGSAGDQIGGGGGGVLDVGADLVGEGGASSTARSSGRRDAAAGSEPRADRGASVLSDDLAGRRDDPQERVADARNDGHYSAGMGG
jgi:hypothetical protein